MILIFETVWKAIAQVVYWIMRFFVWFFTARGCKRCWYYGYGVGCSKYCHLVKISDMAHCLSRPWRPFFMKKDEPKEKRKFFDILK